jgi:hypothetical protein
MCFGIKHAPLIFHKIMRATIEFIRSSLHIRSIAYCDDLVFLCESKEELEEMTPKIISILQRFGWKISQEKSILHPVQ